MKGILKQSKDGNFYISIQNNLTYKLDVNNGFSGCMPGINSSVFFDIEKNNYAVNVRPEEDKNSYIKTITFSEDFIEYFNSKGFEVLDDSINIDPNKLSLPDEQNKIISERGFYKYEYTPEKTLLCKMTSATELSAIGIINANGAIECYYVTKEYKADYYKYLKDVNDVSILNTTVNESEAQELSKKIAINNKDRKRIVYLNNGKQCSDEYSASEIYIPTGRFADDGTEKEIYLMYSILKGSDGFDYRSAVYEGCDITCLESADIWDRFFFGGLIWNDIEKLKEMAAEENWGKNDCVLKKFLKYTLSHELQKDNNGNDNLLRQGKYLFLNTGLESKNDYMAIFGMFEEMQKTPDHHPLAFIPEYKFKDWKLVDENGKYSPYFPKKPYFNKAEDFWFDTKLPIKVDAEHIIKNRQTRLPESFNKKIGENEEYKMFKIKDIIEKAYKRAQYNWRSVVPCYNPERKESSYLMPVYFGDDNKTEILAAVVTKEQNKNDGTYYHQVHTLLTLPMAYQDARLVCSPESPWLDLSQLNNNKDSKKFDTGDDIDDEDEAETDDE